MTSILNSFRNLPSVRRWRYGRLYGERYSDMAMFRTIDGWLHDAEANRLFDLANSLSNNAPVVVELGSWVGKSSVVLGHAIKNKNSPELYCIDPFNADGEDASSDEYRNRQAKLALELRAVFEANVRNFGIPSITHTVAKHSFDAVKTWTKSIDLLFIDASHDYDDVKQDINDWSPFIKPGGVIAFHDVDLNKASLELTGPGRAAKELIADSPDWDNGRLIHSVFSSQKRATPSP